MATILDSTLARLISHFERGMIQLVVVPRDPERPIAEGGAIIKVEVVRPL